MKTMKILTALCLTLLFASLSARAEEPAAEILRAKLARIDAEIAQRSLDLNYRTVECYIDYAERNRLTPPVMTYPGLRYNAVCDTVAAIRELDARYEAANKAYKDILKSDSKYAAIHREYIAINGLKDQQRKDANTEQYNLLYARLREKNKDYTPALDARNDAMWARNIALVRFLLDYYRAQGKSMPTEPLFKNWSNERRAMREACPEIGVSENELSILRRLRSEVYEQLRREELGIPKADGQENVVFLK